MTGSFRLISILLLSAVLFPCCGKKKKTVTAGQDPVDISDFISYFNPLALPWQLNDSVLVKKEKDTLIIKEAVFTRFVPDSVLRKMYTKNTKVKIYPLGRVDAGPETYLFAKTVGANKYALLILAYDKNQEFLASVLFARPASGTLMQTVSMDRKFTLTRAMIRRNKDGTMSEGKDVYVLNAELKEFMLIMTEALDDKMTELINPIDTLPGKHKFAADYSNANMNLVSIRDGRRTGRLSFFIHFEKNNGECTGELKGEAVLRSATMAEYQQDGDPCVLQFIFSKSAVTLKEVQGCGSRRGLQCTFDGNYPRKRATKAIKK